MAARTFTLPTWTRRQYVRECYKTIQSCKRALVQTNSLADRDVLERIIKKYSDELGLPSGS